MASIKQKFQMEFEMRSSPKILYNYISTASGLSEWFADDVRVKEG
ncbi:MAG TPA: START-like domain-containing protein, partial [Bacteroidia bacterium]|nr:START-like domain-containing protein [Bacteroidia bacterium]